MRKDLLLKKEKQLHNKSSKKQKAKETRIHSLRIDLKERMTIL
jgi:hypothetical protein